MQEDQKVTDGTQAAFVLSHATSRPEPHRRSARCARLSRCRYVRCIHRTLGAYAEALGAGPSAPDAERKAAEKVWVLTDEATDLLNSPQTDMGDEDWRGRRRRSQITVRTHHRNQRRGAGVEIRDEAQERASREGCSGRYDKKTRSVPTPTRWSCCTKRPVWKRHAAASR